MGKDDLIFYGNPYYEGLIIIYYRLTLKCNYGCDYCDSFDNKIKFSNSEVLKDSIKFFKSIPPDIPLELHITGGGPALHPNFLEFTN